LATIKRALVGFYQCVQENRSFVPLRTDFL
jgi:MFS family permease